MESALGTIPLQETLIKELLCCHTVLVKFTAFESKATLLKSDTTMIRFHRNQTSFFCLIKITTTLGTAEIINFSGFLAIAEEERVIISFSSIN